MRPDVSTLLPACDQIFKGSIEGLTEERRRGCESAVPVAECRQEDKVPLWTICRTFCLYQELKFPARGVETNPGSWPWFYRMNDAMEGRFAGAAPVLTPIVEDEDEDCEPLSPMPKKRARRSRGGMAEFLTESEMDLLVDNEDKNGSASLGDLQRMAEFTYKREEGCDWSEEHDLRTVLKGAVCGM